MHQAPEQGIGPFTTLPLKRPGPDRRCQGIPCGKGVAGRTPGARSVCK